MRMTPRYAPAAGLLSLPAAGTGVVSCAEAQGKRQSDLAGEGADLVSQALQHMP